MFLTGIENWVLKFMKIRRDMPLDAQFHPQQDSSNNLFYDDEIKLHKQNIVFQTLILFYFFSTMIK